MAIESEFQCWSVTATADLSAASNLFKAVSIAGTLAFGPSLALGVLRSANVSGGQVSAVFRGITKVLVAGAVTTPGYPITVNNSAFFAAASSGGATCGRLLNTAAVASGDLVPALVDFTIKAPWSGL